MTFLGSTSDGWSSGYGFCVVLGIPNLWANSAVLSEEKQSNSQGCFRALFARFLVNSCLVVLTDNGIVLQLVSYAELQESPLYVPLHPYEGYIQILPIVVFVKFF